MLGFKPRPPVSDDVRDWADKAFIRLSKIFGRERWLRAEMILPEDRYFPDRYDGSAESVNAMAGRISGYMGISRDSFKVNVYAEGEESFRKMVPFWSGETKDAAGVYFHEPEDDRFLIGVDARELREPLTVAATLAHELAHVLLLGGRLLDRDVADMEPLTDLCTVYLGLGVLTANAAFRFKQWTTTGQQGWSYSRRGYLPEELWGYALARFAFEHSEPRPTWERSLQGNIRNYFTQSAKWLAKNGSNLSLT